MDQCRRESRPAGRAAGGEPSTPPARKVKARPSEGGRGCAWGRREGEEAVRARRQEGAGQGGGRDGGKGEIMKEEEARNRGKDRKRGSKQKGRKDVCQNRPVRGHWS